MVLHSGLVFEKYIRLLSIQLSDTDILKLEPKAARKTIIT